MGRRGRTKANDSHEKKEEDAEVDVISYLSPVAGGEVLASGGMCRYLFLK